jgi:hypothetical protein
VRAIGIDAATNAVKGAWLLWMLHGASAALRRVPFLTAVRAASAARSAALVEVALIPAEPTNTGGKISARCAIPPPP